MLVYIVQWSEVKCSDVRWNEAERNLYGVKPNERVVKRNWVKFKWEKWSVDKCSGVKCSWVKF